jgi:integrase/recombinase XerD
MSADELPIDVEEFLTHLAIEKGRSANTLTAYRRDLGKYVQFLDPTGVTSAEAQHVFEFQASLRGHGLARSSVNRTMTAVRGLHRFLFAEGVMVSDPTGDIEPNRLPKGLPKALPEAEIVELIDAVKGTDTFALRDRAILEVLYSTGIRRQEIIDLDVYSVDLHGGTLTVRLGKGKKDRMIPIGRRALAWVEKYLEEVRPSLTMTPDDGILFLTTHRRPFSPERMSLMVRQHVEAADIGKSGSCHIFRHTMATLMLEGGADTRFIQAMLGHADISTTQIYTHVAIRKLKEIHELTHPGAKLERLNRENDEDEEAPLTPEELLSSLAAEEDD